MAETYKATAKKKQTNLSPTPMLPEATDPSSSQSVKAATPDLILLDQDVMPLEQIQSLVFDQIAGTEIIQIARHDLVNGQVIDYGLISNISDIQLKNNSKNIIFMPDSSENIFKSFPINLLSHTPEETAIHSPVYFDTYGNLVIEIEDPKDSYEIEVQVFDSAQVLDGTIYEAIPEGSLGV